jgi:hypothetical protein
MKFTNLLAVAAIAAVASCKPSYKATDTTTGNTDTTGTTTITVNPATQTAFITQYPNASNVVWSNYDVAVTSPIDWDMAGWNTMDTDDYLVRFDMDNENYYAWYDSDGNWIGSAYAMKDHTQLPPAVTTIINDKYAGYTIDNVNREFQKDRMAYEIEMKKEDSKVKLLVDSDGNILKEKVK